VDLSGGAVYLSIFATGVRNAQSVAVTVGGQSVPVTYSGPQGKYAGLDQINVGPLPASLAGRGRVNIVMTSRDGHGDRRPPPATAGHPRIFDRWPIPAYTVNWKARSDATAPGTAR
jgi:hypothetical protein